ncbi:MAG: UDP-N-acetylmuramoyl-L-alanyl-D-glutamate--2,6-diaminopimelate ligase [Chloroflexota bacterium]
MLLRELAEALPHVRLVGDGDVEITSIEQDSRGVGSGSLFVAVPGFKVDGHAYLGRAIQGGAPAVVVQEDHSGIWQSVVEGGGVDLLVVPDTRVALAQLSAAFFDYPARKLRVVGITGTDGKTSLAYLVAHVFNSAGLKTGLISTAECRIGDEVLPDTGRFTTPEAPQVQAMLALMAEAGCEWAIIEATSHGLSLHRVDECEYDIAAFTNVGSDHLDFHGSREDYVAAKGRLFSLLDQSVDKGIKKTAVLNADDFAAIQFGGLTKARRIRYGADPLENVWIESCETNGFGSDLVINLMSLKQDLHDDEIDEGRLRLHFSKPGMFNAYNVAAAASIALAAGLRIYQIADALESWPGAPGRMERVDAGQPFSVIVDFAHSPDSLRRMLELLRTTTSGRVFAVFGCIGERDKDRRPGMAKAAAELADYTFVTDDNPYSEDRDVILQDIAAGLLAADKRDGHDFSVVPDRREAISQALAMAVDEDVVLLAGKGHEREVHIGDEVYACYDPDEARKVLRELGYAGGQS